MTFTARQMTPLDVTQTNPVRVTVTAHGLSNGDRVRASDFTSPQAPVNTGMYNLNNQLFELRVIDADTFDLYYIDAALDRRVDGTGYAAFTGLGSPEFTLTGPDLDVQNTA